MLIIAHYNTGMDIEWKQLPGTPYSVSSAGDVERINGSGGSATRKRLSGTLTSQGYVQVSLWVGKREIKARVGRLVATLFIGPPPTPAHQVNHKDWNRANNRLDNLEWATPGENTRHSLARPGARPAKAAHFRKLSEDDARAVRERAAQGESFASIARSLSVRPATIGNIVRGKSWAWLDEGKPLPTIAKVVRKDAKGRFCQ